MNLDEFSQQIEALHERVAALLKRTDSEPESQQELLMLAFEEINVASEELQVAESELRQQNQELCQQNEDLVAARHTALSERQRYQDLFEEAPDGYLVTDTSGMIQEANRAAATLLNVRQKYLVGKPLINFVAAQERRDFYAKLTLPCQQDCVQEWEVRLCPRNREPVDAALTVAAVHNRDGSLVALRVCIRDITQRKHSEQKMREQSALLELTTDAIFVRNRQNQILFWNKGAERLYGWTVAEALGKDALELLYKASSAQLQEAQNTVAEKGSWQGELHQVTKSGKQILVASRWTLVRDFEGQPQSILVVNTDITEKKQLEAQFLRAQRLESLGTLASGMAHDLNNVLAPILMSLQLLEMKFPDSHAQRLLQTLETNVKRGAALVKQVLSFARGVEGDRMILQVRHLILEIEQIAKQTFPKSIEVYTDIPNDLWTVSGNATQLHQVLINLVVNARDGMPDGVALYAEHQDEISMVLTDMMMPSMDGSTTIRTLQKMNPLVKIVAVSGLASSDKVALAAGVGVKAFLSKPYTVKELLQTIKAVKSAN